MLYRFIFVLLSVILSLVSCELQVLCQVGTWRTFSNTNYINDIVREEDTLWVATSGGVITFDVHEKRYMNTYTNVEGLAHVVVTSIVIDRRGYNWFGTDGGGISKWNRSAGTWRTYTEFDGVALHVRSLRQDGDILWVGTDEGIAFFQWGWDWEEKDTSYVWKENYDTRNGLPSDAITAFTTDDTMVWVGTAGGVSSALKNSNLKNPSNWTTYTVDDGLPSSGVLSLAVYGSQVWVGTDRGAIFYNGTSWSEGGFSGSLVHSLKVLSDTLWAGTSLGVYKLKDAQWIGVARESLPSQDIRVLALTENGFLFSGMWGMGLAELDGTSWNQYMTEGLWNNNCLSVAVDFNDFTWCGTRDDRFRGKISQYSKGAWSTFDEDDGIKNGEGVFSIVVDHQGRKWFGTWGDGVSMLDDKGTLNKEDDELKVFYASNSGIHGIPDDPNFEVVPALDENTQGAVWFANYFFGLVVYSPLNNLWESFTTTDGLADWLVLSLAVVGEEQIWIGTEQNGVNLLNYAGTPFQKDDDTWVTFNAQNDFTNSTVNSIVIGEGDSLWFGTNEGLFTYNGEKFKRNPNIQNTGVLSLGKDARRNLWVGTSDQGVYVFDRFGTFRIQYTSDNSGLVSNTVNDIDANTTTGEVWMATPLGLSRYESGIVTLEGEGEKINFFPNPFLPSQGHTGVTFFQLPENPSLRMYTLSGELIVELRPEAHSPDLIFWNGENQSEEKVGSGIYILMLMAPGEDPRLGKLAVVR